MPIFFRCACGTTLQSPDNSSGTQVRCQSCKVVLTVPSPAVAPVPVVPTATAMRAQWQEVPDQPARRRQASGTGGVAPARSRSGGSSSLWLIVGIAVAGILLLGCLGIGGIALYFFGFSSASPEAQLVGDWEIDPESAANNSVGIAMMPDMTISFNKDHTFRLSFVIQSEGKWNIVSRDGNRLQVKLVTRMFGMDQSDPPTVKITMLDRDHMQSDSNERSLQLQGHFRRVGTGPSRTARPAAPAGKGTARPGFVAGDPWKSSGGIDAKMEADCEVEWNGVRYPAKVIKKENDRWFIHYIGFQDNWDEWVGKDRIRFKK